MNVDWSLDNQYIASASLDGIVRLWPTQDFIKTLNGYMLKSFSVLKLRFVYITYCLLFSEDRQVLCCNQKRHKFIQRIAQAFSH